MNLAVAVSLEAVHTHTFCSLEKNKHIPIYFIKVVMDKSLALLLCILINFVL